MPYYDDLYGSLKVMKSIKDLADSGGSEKLLRSLLNDLRETQDEEYKYKTMSDERYMGDMFGKWNPDTPTTPVTINLSLSIQQFKAIPLPFKIETIADGIEVDVMKKLRDFITTISSNYITNKEKNVSLTINARKLIKLCDSDHNKSLNKFLKNNRYEAFTNNILPGEIEHIYTNNLKDMLDSIDDNISISNKFKVKNINVDFKNTPESEINDTFSKTDASYQPMTKHKNDIPIYIDLVGQVAYVCQTIRIEYEVPSSEKYNLLNAQEYLKALSHLVNYVNSIMIHKTYNGFIINDDDADILKNISDGGDAGFRFSYNKQNPKKSNLLFVEQDRNKSIITLTHSGK